MRVIAFCNQKGGVGKTTSCLNIGVGLQRAGRRVLLIDLDPQGHLTASMGINPDELEYTVMDFMMGRVGFSEVVRTFADNLVLLPANIDLSGLDLALASMPGREFTLRKALRGGFAYDYILLDCPPNLGILTLNALVAAKEVFIPLTLEYLPLRGLSALISTIDLVRDRLNPDLTITGIIGTRVNARKILSKQVIDQIREIFGDKLFRTQIRENVSLAEAPSHGLDIFAYMPRSIGAEDYGNLVEEILACET